MKVIEQTASRAAQTELGAPPCQQCDPSQPRRVATIYCDSCASFLCAEHEKLLHAVPALANHTLVSLAEKAQQQQASSQSTHLLRQAAAPFKALLQLYRNDIDRLVFRSRQPFQNGQKLVELTSQRLTVAAGDDGEIS